MANYYKTAAATISTGDQESSAVKIEGFKDINIEIPTCAAGLATAQANVYLKGASVSTGTFRPLYCWSDSDMTRFGHDLTTGNEILDCNRVSLPGYIKVAVDGTNSTATATAGLQCNVYMMR